MLESYIYGDLKTNKTVFILPLEDFKNDKIWCKNLDKQIENVYPNNNNIILYGGRDSFLKVYTGKFKTEEFTEKIEFTSSTFVKNEIINGEPIDSSEFRKGVVYGIGKLYPRIIPTVNVVVWCKTDGKIKILLGKKEYENDWIFPGGIVNLSDESFEDAALRELQQGYGINLNVEKEEIKFIGSYTINDWRYNKNKDVKIITSFYSFPFLYGYSLGTDDFEKTKWFDIDYLNENYEYIIDFQHIKLFKELNNFFKTKENKS
jgi:bifunctional NMN adenylyltransferase/nudix hydrolase